MNGSFFAPGHDKRAQAAVITEFFGSIPEFLAAFGRAPGDAMSQLSAGSVAPGRISLAERTVLQAQLSRARDAVAHALAVLGPLADRGDAW
jgi:hypothetical protein